MERIEINGVWYVKEDTSSQIELEISKFKGMVLESKDYCFEAILTQKDDGTYYDGVDIKFTDKRVDYNNWKVEHWDNNEWCIEVLNNTPEALEELKSENIDVAIVKLIFQKLLDMGWLKLNKDEK